VRLRRDVLPNRLLQRHDLQRRILRHLWDQRHPVRRLPRRSALRRRHVSVRRDLLPDRVLRGRDLSPQRAIRLWHKRGELYGLRPRESRQLRGRHLQVRNGRCVRSRPTLFQWRLRVRCDFVSRRVLQWSRLQDLLKCHLWRQRGGLCRVYLRPELRRWSVYV
jgi:hypothetical protein